MNTQKQIFLIVVLVFVTTAGCAAYTAIDLPIRAEIQEEYQYEGRVERGALLFANNCRTCHGIRGEGFVGPALNGTERAAQGLDNFQDQNPLVLAANQNLIRRTIECGRAGTRMPAWLNTNGGSLSRLQIEHLVEFLTDPADEEDAEGNPTSKGWEEAEEFAHNLNHETVAVIGGDTLATIAKSHHIGPQELFEHNERLGTLEFQDGEEPGVNAFLERGSKIRLLPDNDEGGEGYEYQIRQDNDTITKIAEGHFTGAILIANENGFPYDVSHDDATFTLEDENGNAIAGLYPGQVIKLPAGASYTVVAGDTLATPEAEGDEPARPGIAERHGLEPDAIRALNEDTLPSSIEDDAELEAEFMLTLPDGSRVIAQDTDTLGTIASTHGLEAADLAALNNLSEDAELTAGQQINLPDDTRYTVQLGDTIASVANAHGISADVLATENNLEADAVISPQVILELPKVDEYQVQGQTLDQVAEGYGNVTVDRLAEVNNLDPTLVYRIGTNLALPEEAYGSAPPDALNPGVCAQHIVPPTPDFEPTRPDTESTDVVITANANDWLVNADGDEMTPNQGVVIIAAGTAIRFVNAVGLHTITLNRDEEGNEKVGENFTEGEERTVTFDEPGEYAILCDFHPAMFAYAYVE